jgi:DNA-binding transcriptional MerR regulator
MEHTIGELARRSGLTVRALHHYEKLGLLRPSARTEAGYRLYGQDDILTLHRILAYQQMGLALKDIGPLLGPQAPPLADLLARQIDIAQDELTRQQNLLAMLKRVASRASAGGPELSDQLLSLMALRRNYERWFSEAEMQKLLDAQNTLGEAGMARMKAEWARLVPALRLQMERGAGPRTPAVRALARRWIALGEGLPDDEEVRRKARDMFARQPELLQGTGLTLELLDFLDRAVAAEKTARKGRA